MNKIERLHAGGILRAGGPDRGFSYRLADGRSVDAADLERIASLRIPPAWQDVAINASSKGDLQAVGLDKAGRWQYLYHAAHDRRREFQKSRRLVHFLKALPSLRKAVKRDLRGADLSREKVLASILRILSRCFLRPGSRVYADENGSFGIATLRRSHVSVHGPVIHFDFNGKSGKRQQHDLRDPSVARTVRQLLKIPGRQVFKFRNEAGEVVFVRRRHINQYIKEVMGERFSAKDFRTWAGTLICAGELARAESDVAPPGPPRPAQARSSRKSAVRAAIQLTSEYLGNTPAVCRTSYISPAILDRYEKGEVIDCGPAKTQDLISHRGSSLHPAEKSLLALLEGEASRRPRTRSLAHLLRASLKSRSNPRAAAAVARPSLTKKVVAG